MVIMQMVPVAYSGQDPCLIEPEGPACYPI